MSKRHIYDEAIDFHQLADQSPDFKRYLHANGQLNFRDPAAVRQLTISLLARDFGLAVDPPNDRLCPAVPNRWTYVCWVQDLLDSTAGEGEDDEASDPDHRRVTGLDIGTGASCIYPLLACASRPRWRLVATELDAASVRHAQETVRRNGLESRIRPVQVGSAEDPLIPLDTLGLDRIDFTMCNPPFYASAEDMLQSAASKSKPPNSACTGAEIEMVTPGGEVAFVDRMLQESKTLLGRVQWYTTMLGKLSSVITIVEHLRAQGIKNWAVQEFVQGAKTRRWGVAWSWRGARPTLAVARGISSIPKEILPFPSEQSITIPNTGRDMLGERALRVLSALDLTWKYQHSVHQGVGVASKNVWSRAARRREKQKGMTADQTEESEEDGDEPALAFKLTFSSGGNDGVVLVRWLVGQDSVLFESFCGMLRRSLVSPT